MVPAKAFEPPRHPNARREDFGRYDKGERPALGKSRLPRRGKAYISHGDSAQEIERKVRDAYLKGLRDGERREPLTDIERARRGRKLAKPVLHYSLS